MKAPVIITIRGSLFALAFATAVAGAACSSTSPSTDNGTGGKTNSTTGKGGSTGGPVTGQGGNTGGPVTGQGGNPGGGGAGVVQKLCAAKATVATPVLLNFENYDGTVTADKYANTFAPNAYTGPYAFGDGSATPTLALLAGRPPSQWAVSETITQARTWGMGGGFWMSCANAAAYKGISFWVRGSSPVNVFSFGVATENTSLPDATNPAGGGTCTGTMDTCRPPTKTDIPLTADWTQVSLMWADFTPGLNGSTPVALTGDNITGFLWTVPLSFVLSPTAGGDANGPYVAVAGDLVINIDDVQFIP